MGHVCKVSIFNASGTIVTLAHKQSKMYILWSLEQLLKLIMQRYTPPKKRCSNNTKEGRKGGIEDGQTISN